MFGIDFSEILLIFGIALVVLGPEKLPKLANTIGKWIGRARGMARQFREQLEQETQTLHKSVDLRQDLDLSSHSSAQPGNDSSVPRPTADSSTARLEPQAQAQPRIDPRPVGPPAPTRPTVPVGSVPVAPMTGPPLPEMGLADTYPAAFHPYQLPPIAEPAPITEPPPSAASAGAVGSAADGSAQTASATGEAGEAGTQHDSFPAPHQTAFWPPDGVL